MILKKKTATRLLILAMLLMGWTSQIQAQSKSLELLKSELKSGKVIEAELTSLFVDSFTGDTSRAEGKIQIHKKGYRVDSDDRIILVYDSVSTVYSSIKKQAIISTYQADDDDFAPSKFINATQQDYGITEKKTVNGWLVELVSKDDFAVFRQIILDLRENGLPRFIRAYDQQGNLSESKFHNERFTRLNENLRALTFSADTEIIDLRN